MKNWIKSYLKVILSVWFYIALSFGTAYLTVNFLDYFLEKTVREAVRDIFD